MRASCCSSVPVDTSPPVQQAGSPDGNALTPDEPAGRWGKGIRFGAASGRGGAGASGRRTRGGNRAAQPAEQFPTSPRERSHTVTMRLYGPDSVAHRRVSRMPESWAVILAVSAAGAVPHGVAPTGQPETDRAASQR